MIKHAIDALNADIKHLEYNIDALERDICNKWLDKKIISSECEKLCIGCAREERDALYNQIELYKVKIKSYEKAILILEDIGGIIS